MPIIPKTFLRGTALSAGAAILIGIGNYFVRRLTANHLSADDYAFYYSSCALLNFLLILTHFGTSEVLLYELPGILAQRRFTLAGTIYRRVRRFQLLLAGIFFLLLLAAIPFLKKHYYDFPVSTGQLLLFFPLIFALTLENTVLYALNSFKKFGSVSALKILKCVLFLAAVLMALQTGSFMVILAASVIVTTLCTLLGDRMMVRLIPKTGRTPLRLRKKIFQDGAVFTILACGYLITEDAGTLAVSFFSTKNEVVLFNIALPIAMIIYAFSPVLQVFMPMIAESYAAGEKEKLKQLFRLMFLLIAAAMTAAFFLFYFAGEWVISLLFSGKFIAARISTLILVEAALLATLTRSLMNFFNTIGLQKLSVRALYPTLAMALPAFPLLAWQYGAAGAAAATLFSTLVWLAAYCRYYHKFMREWQV